MTDEQKTFIQNLLNKSRTGNEWLQIMKFGMSQLIRNQRFLFELIRQKAESQARDGSPNAKPFDLTDEMQHICKELDLTLDITIKQKPNMREAELNR